MPEPELDDVDRLFARTGLVEPPEDFLRRIMMQASADGVLPRRRVPRAAVAMYAGVYALAFMGLAILAYNLGLAIGHSGTTALLSVLAADVTLLTDAPAAYLGALLASLPWLHLAATLIDVAIIGLITALLLRGARSAQWGPTAKAV
jgi:hypothetical protein